MLAATNWTSCWRGKIPKSNVGSDNSTMADKAQSEKKERDIACALSGYPSLSGNIPAACFPQCRQLFQAGKRRHLRMRDWLIMRIGAEVEYLHSGSDP